MDFSNILGFLQNLLTNKQGMQSSEFGQNLGLQQSELGQQQQEFGQQLGLETTAQSEANQLAQAQQALAAKNQADQLALQQAQQQQAAQQQAWQQQFAQQQAGPGQGTAGWYSLMNFLNNTRGGAGDPAAPSTRAPKNGWTDFMGNFHTGPVPSWGL